MKGLNELERRIRPYAVQNLMQYVVIGQAAVYLVALFFNAGIFSLLTLNRAMLLRGQVWRLVSFVLVPYNTDVLFFLIEEYFLYVIGTSLEREWGTGWFNLYFLSGMAGAIVACLLTGWASNSGLITALFLAFALLHPRHQVLLFFVIPIEMRWLAVAEGVVWLLQWLPSPLPHKLAMLLELLPFLLFFGPQLLHEAQAWNRRRQWKNRNRR